MSFSEFGANLGWAFVVTLLPDYLVETFAVPIEERGTMASVPLMVGSLGMLAGGWLTDFLTRRLGLRWGRAAPNSLSKFISAAAFLACLWLPSAWGVVAAMAVMAVTTDIAVPTVWAFSQDIGGRHAGAALGFSNMWGNMGAALSPVVLAGARGRRLESGIPGRRDQLHTSGHRRGIRRRQEADRSQDGRPNLSTASSEVRLDKSLTLG